MTIKKLFIYCVFALSSVAAMTPAMARNDISNHSIEEALKHGDDAERIDPNIALVFAGQQHGEIEKKLGSAEFSQKSNGFNRSDEYACQRAFLSALLNLQQEARQKGANAVVNITSHYYKESLASATHYACGSGFLMSGVTMKGDFVTLRK
jgi:uncharacterized protein YbjQ (UPF0145 family)